eukprot:TRINITY_DN122250_c0_g1_i1.p2 TRINITY_DN122250_c0_g1~~TRINITY_DN122250_c0_g1_i1.p2  ORF type:complete len:268 (-),score=60.52 TRINITY_DN122250_c0_g1_i1:97-900(-)
MYGFGYGAFGGGIGHQTGPGFHRAETHDGNSLGDDVPPEVRRGFVQKVYGILGMQLLLTTAVGAAVMRAGKALPQTHPGMVMLMLFGSVFMSIAMMFVFMCCPDSMRKSPTNYLLLLCFTVAKGIMVGFISLQYTKETVIIGLAMTTLAVSALTLFACCTKIDVTGYGHYVGCAMMVLGGFGFFMMISSFFGLGASPAFQALHLVYAALGALIFSAYLVFDTQLIIGGKHHKREFSIDDYTMAAISIYIDIIELFVYLLQLLGHRRQ